MNWLPLDDRRLTMTAFSALGPIIATEYFRYTNSFAATVRVPLLVCCTSKLRWVQCIESFESLLSALSEIG